MPSGLAFFPREGYFTPWYFLLLFQYKSLLCWFLLIFIYSHLEARHLSNKGIDTWPDSVMIKAKVRLNDVFLITEKIWKQLNRLRNYSEEN